MDVPLALIGVAWLAIGLMLAWGAVVSIYGLFGGRPPLPFFAMLDLKGLTYAQLERANGPAAMARALERCGACQRRPHCDGTLAGCPNAPLVHHARAFAAAVA